MPATRSRRGVVATAVLAALLFPFLTATPATAAAVSVTIDGVTYTADDANPAAGASATTYTPGVLDVVIRDSVVIGGVTYPVTSIGTLAFASSPITSLVIPDSVTTIGVNACNSCTSLTSLDLGEGVQSIGAFAFTNSQSLQSLVIPDSVTDIGIYAFDSLDLRSLTIGSGLTVIQDQVFANNNRLQSVVIPPTVTRIGVAAFAADDLRHLVIGSGVTTIDRVAFAFNNRLESVVIPASVTSIGELAFRNNSSGGQSLTATFEGAPPPAFGANVFLVANPLLRYHWRYGDPQFAGGFTSPTWNGYPTQALATVTFDAGATATSPADILVPVGTAATKPADPAATGFVFDGWRVAPGGAAFDFATPVTGDLALEASWSTGGGAGGILPVTGREVEDALIPALVALGVLLAGAALLVIARRRATR